MKYEELFQELRKKYTVEEIAEDIAIHYPKQSRIPNDKEEPKVELCYRLEKYAGNLIKAELW